MLIFFCQTTLFFLGRLMKNNINKSIRNKCDEKCIFKMLLKLWKDFCINSTQAFSTAAQQYSLKYKSNFRKKLNKFFSRMYVTLESALLNTVYVIIFFNHIYRHIHICIHSFVVLLIQLMQLVFHSFHQRGAFVCHFPKYLMHEELLTHPLLSSLFSLGVKGRDGFQIGSHESLWELHREVRYMYFLTLLLK